MNSFTRPIRRPRSNDFRYDDFRYDDERLLFVQRASGLPMVQFAREIGLPDSEILFQIKIGKAPLDSEIVGRIHNRYPQIDPCWLLTGKVRNSPKETTGLEASGPEATGPEATGPETDGAY